MRRTGGPSLPRQDEIQRGLVHFVRDELANARDAGQLRVRGSPGVEQDVDRPGVEPVLVKRPQRPHRPVGDSVEFTALDRECSVRGAFVALDELEFRPSQIVERHRHDFENRRLRRFPASAIR